MLGIEVPATASVASVEDDDGITSAVDDSTEEVRFAVTMTGGVSLAVWMGGVAREIDLIMQASKARRALQVDPTGQPPDAPSPDASAVAQPAGPILGDTPAQSPGGQSSASSETPAQIPRGQSGAVEAERALWGRLLELLDIAVEVDVLSGSSAGGVNAAMLAYTRVRNGDLGVLRGIWLELGALLDLLRKPTDANIPSLLYGDEWMFSKLGEMLPTLAPLAPPKKPPSTTLYVTTTLLSGESTGFTDSLGNLVQDNNQRGLFTFDETQLATPGVEGALALAARSSASFPGAFEPSYLPLDKPTPLTGKVPLRPAMRQFTNITRDHWVADGGILDNQPLDVLLTRIFDRRARRSVRRVLLYVVPTPGPVSDLSAAGPVDQLVAPYGLLEALMKDLAAATGQSISGDLHAITAHNDHIDARVDLRKQLAEMGTRLGAGARLLTTGLLDTYRDREGERQARLLVDALLTQLGTWAPQTAANPIGIPPTWQSAIKLGSRFQPDTCAEIKATLIGGWPRAVDPNGTPGQAWLPTTGQALARFGQDAYDNGKSMVLALLKKAYQAATEAADRNELLRGVVAVHDGASVPNRPDPAAIVSTVLQSAVETQPPPPIQDATSTLATTWVTNTNLDGQAWPALGQVLVDARAVLTRISGQDDFVAALAAYLGLLGEPDIAAVTIALFDLAIAERALIPVEAGPYQPVQLVQMSADTRGLLTPRNATAASKLTGVQFHNFGAFYKKSWRANDWMWGRLDAAGWLVQTLLDPRRLQVVAARRGTAEPASQWLLGRLYQFGAIAPRDSDVSPDDTPTLNAIKAELTFLDTPGAPVPASLPQTSLWLATAWQRLIVSDELPATARVVLGQQGEKVDHSPAGTVEWAQNVLADGSNLDALVADCPIAKEKFDTDMGTPLMVLTVAKAAATAANVVSSVEQIPGPVRPAISAVHTVTMGGYRAVTAAKAIPRYIIITGLVLLVLGIALATQSETLLGVAGLVFVGVGAYLVTFATWQISSRLLGALVAVTLVLAVGSLAVLPIRRGLFGTSATDSGYVGRHLYWLGNTWWHPLVVVGIGIVLVILAGTVARRKRRSR